jgi:hypothetical protein
VHFDTTLNLAWLVLGILALARTIRVAFRQTGVRTGKSRCLHIVGIGLILAALFPYISATDDVLRIEHFQAKHDPRHSTKQTQNDQLMRLYETMDSPLVCPVSELALVFFFISIVFAPAARLLERIAPLHAGRSPPLLASS